MDNAERKNVVYVNTATISCGGINSEVDHPKVYLQINKNRNTTPSVTCTYCRKEYILRTS